MADRVEREARMRELMAAHFSKIIKRAINPEEFSEFDIDSWEVLWEAATIAEHQSHVDFENELYATLVDPLADGAIKESNMRARLMESARWYRQHVEDIENQLNKLRAAQP